VFRRNLLILCLCWHALAPCHAVCRADDTPAAPGCDETVHFSRVAQADAHTALKASFLVRGDADLVYETLRDAEKFPEFMPNTDEVQVLEHAADHRIVSFKGSSGLFKSEIVLRRVADDRSRRISWNLIRGSLKSSDGFWSVEHDPACGASRVNYSNTVDAKLPVPASLVQSFLRKSIEDTAVSLRRRVASNGTWQSEEYRKRLKKSR
jgi:ribosome-associated toxin RatA of RatAB toxin-antitoxin module